MRRYTDTDTYITEAELLKIGFSLRSTDPGAYIAPHGEKRVAWHHLARLDGEAALAVMPAGAIDKVHQELYRAGLPAGTRLTPQELVHLLLASAEGDMPTGDWYSEELHAAVACARLLKLVQQALGFDAEETRKREAEAFAARLGVASTLEH